MSDIVIKTEGLSFSYDEDDGSRLAVLKEFDLEIERGTFVALLGHNGSGKSTLAKLFNLILSPTSGSLYLFGEKIDEEKMTEDDLYALRQRVGMVFQNPDNQLVATIVEEDVAFGPENLGVPPKEIRERVDKALEIVGMTKFARHSPHQLSGGQKQRVAIAGIIACDPEIIIFDESTAMLDPIGRAEVLETIEKLNKENGTTVILITHYMEEAARADRVVVIDDGKRLLDGTPKEVFSKTKILRGAGLDVPQTTLLLQELADEGFALPRDALTPEEGARALAKILSEKGRKI
ncbi:MAG: energy-coupling factor transporter ATPase [Ruminococcaceae bacterium]|nr:energy-coupling factor transporter ATPase [Oscillospiraceae bacterium]